VGSRTRVDGWLWLATACGAVHAAFSAVWAFGSDVLIETVGPVADQVTALGPARAAALLGAVALAKATLVAAPLADAAGWFDRRRWRGLARRGELVAGVCLVLYGGLSMVGAALRLLDSPTPADRTSAWGHLVGWDLLFLLWGVGLTVHVWRLLRPSCAPADEV
jgi:hypothetical protein